MISDGIAQYTSSLVIACATTDVLVPCDATPQDSTDVKPSTISVNGVMTDRMITHGRRRKTCQNNSYKRVKHSTDYIKGVKTRKPKISLTHNRFLY